MQFNISKGFVFLIAAAQLLFFQVEAAKMHAIVVCDTTDDSLKRASLCDYHKMCDKLRFLAETAHIKLHLTSCIGKKARPEVLLKAVQKLKVDADDVIFFYFAGHGFREKSKQDEFPHIHFEESETACDFFSITQQLIEKEPRLLISLSDCCNQYIPDAFLPEIVRNHSYWPSQKERVQALLLHSEGFFIGTGAKPGSDAYSWETGSAFTQAFLDMLDEEVEENDVPDWQHVIDRIDLHFQSNGQSEQEPLCYFFNVRPSKELKL